MLERGEKVILFCAHRLQIDANMGRPTIFCVVFVENIGVYFLECFKYFILYNDDCLKIRVGVL